MGRREFDVFRNAPAEYQDYIRRIYEITAGDQENTPYIITTIKQDDPSQSKRLELVDITELDFGTVINVESQKNDFTEPPTPDLPRSAYLNENIENDLFAASHELKLFVEKLMEGQRVDPFIAEGEDIGIRAGGLISGQRDAYIWPFAPFTNAVILTINFPHQYKSVSVVRGKMVEPGNGKPHMAQILKPEIIFQIQGEDLKELQRIYKILYKLPDYALTEEQRIQRDNIFNNYLIKLISEQANLNRRKEEEDRLARQRHEEPKLNQIDY